MFKRSITFTERDDDDLPEQVSKFGYQHEFADIAWYPASRRVVYRIDDRLPMNASGEGVFNFIGFRATPEYPNSYVSRRHTTQMASSLASGAT
jgi:hypothetical protein